MTDKTLWGMGKLLDKATSKEWKYDGDCDIYTQGEKYQEYHVQCKFHGDAPCIVALHNNAKELLRLAGIGLIIVKESKKDGNGIAWAISNSVVNEYDSQDGANITLGDIHKESTERE